VGARYSRLFFRVEVNREPVIITINEKIGRPHTDWLASDQATGIWNYQTEQKHTMAPVAKAWIVTTVWFTDLKTAMGFKLTFG
jgi:hypothetical protein